MKAVCLNTRSDGHFTVGKSYSFYDTTTYPISLQIIADNGVKMNVQRWTDDFTEAGHNTFRIIRFDDYLNQAELCLK